MGVSPHLVKQGKGVTRSKYMQAYAYSSLAPIVQWIKQLRPKEKL